MKTQLQRYKGEWVIKYVEGNNKTFDWGYDVFECGICKFFKQQNAEDLTPFECLIDYTSIRSAGFGFNRTQTLLNGASFCDFRYIKDGFTPRGWPPENLPEFLI